MNAEWVLSPTALDDLEGILDYVAEQSGSFEVTQLECFETSPTHLTSTETVPGSPAAR